MKTGPYNSALVLLAAASVLALVKGSGEYCHGWSDNSGTWHEGFQCPEKYDEAEATFCCGTCNLRYCCSVLEARLDQGLCYNDHYLDLETEGQASKKPPAVPMYLPFLVVGSVFVTFVVVGALIAICCCRCLKPKEDQQNESLPIQSRLLGSGPLAEAMTPSRPSSSSSNSTTRSSLAARQPTNNICSVGAENLNLYMSVPPVFPVMGCPQPAPFLPSPSSVNTPYLQPHYLGYGIAPDHTMMMAPQYINCKTDFGQQHGICYPPALSMNNKQTGSALQ
ncbi:shisa family member 2a [Latimeria chalumnae]|uniref:shisa family member 2a n=1 Tax=Latimeria chalumnae TaxID=7897 RepID=UPI0003C19FC0|nr:PREDICTED: protein shisa-1-like [Latimeria chalumnae]|eukprot:XP_005998270.1 PREDICTED: protein shisa-1-like [Latimeria chalumnae]